MTAPRCAVAIVGMAGRFPGAPNVAAFWRNLCDGVETIRRFDQAELRDDVDASVRAGESYVRARATLADADLFDAEFFGIHAADAERIDPQHRLLLECCWEALEDAGYDPSTYPGAIGVYAGCSINTYFLNNVLGDRSAIDRFTSDYPVGSYAELLGGGQDFLATRVAYKLGLRGPAITMQSACSTSLLTVAQACQALMTGQADMMLAGGVSISFPQERGYVHQSGGMASADGHCRTFDAQASGTVFGDGVGVVLLKRLDDALADGDTICAVVRGSASTTTDPRRSGTPPRARPARPRRSRRRSRCRASTRRRSASSNVTARRRRSAIRSKSRRSRARSRSTAARGGARSVRSSRTSDTSTSRRASPD